MKSKNLSDSILKSVKSNGFKYIELDTVIPTNLIVERSGESFRRFIFSFNDQNGNELCLRPDLTIASCLRYLNEKINGTAKVHYYGQAFRKNLKRTDDILQILKDNNIGDYIQNKIISETTNAIEALKKVDDSTYKESLVNLAHYCTKREV